MYQEILTPRTSPVVTPEELAVFGRFECPQKYDSISSDQTVTPEYGLLQTFIDAATDQVETMAATACLTEQVLLTLDFFPNTQDPRNFLQYELAYAFAVTPWWWWGYPTKDSIELVRRPVLVPSTAGNTPATITAISVANNTVTVTCDNTLSVGDVVVLADTQEGNIYQPQTTPSTTPFLNGSLLTVASVISAGSPATQTGFTAAFNFYTLENGTQMVPQTYENDSDTGTATLVTNPLLITYNDQNGILQTWNSLNYTVQYNKVCLSVGNWWPMTDRRQDCIQISYWAGKTTNPCDAPARLKMATLFLANHFWENRSIVAVEPTAEIFATLCLMLSSYRTFRIPR